MFQQTIFESDDKIAIETSIKIAIENHEPRTLLACISMIAKTLGIDLPIQLLSKENFITESPKWIPITQKLPDIGQTILVIKEDPKHDLVPQLEIYRWRKGSLDNKIKRKWNITYWTPILKIPLSIMSFVECSEFLPKV